MIAPVYNHSIGIWKSGAMSESDCETTYCLKLLHCWLHFSDLEAASVSYAVCGPERTVSVFEHLEIGAQTGCWSPESVLDGVCDLEPSSSRSPTREATGVWGVLLWTKLTYWWRVDRWRLLVTGCTFSISPDFRPGKHCPKMERCSVTPSWWESNPA